MIHDHCKPLSSPSILVTPRADVIHPSRVQTRVHTDHFTPLLPPSQRGGAAIVGWLMWPSDVICVACHAGFGRQLGCCSLPPILSKRKLLARLQTVHLSLRLLPSRLLILFLGRQIHNRDLILGRADHLVRVGTVPAQDIRVIHFLLDSEAEVSSEGAGLN